MTIASRLSKVDNMTFKYFKYPERFGAFLQEEATCDCCKKTKKCFDGELFYGENPIDAVCESCLAEGKLKPLAIYTNDADGQGLVNQLAARYPNKTAAEILEEARAKTDIVETQTPAILSWQDWKVPAIDGDYGVFLGFASKRDYIRVAKSLELEDAAEFFKSTLHPDWKGHINLDLLWEQVPKKYIKELKGSNHDVIFYLFKSTTSETYLTIWDTN